MRRFVSFPGRSRDPDGTPNKKDSYDGSRRCPGPDPTPISPNKKDSPTPHVGAQVPPWLTAASNKCVAREAAVAVTPEGIT